MFGPTILLCVFLTDAVGRKGVWLTGSVAVAASILILARTRTYRGALVAVVLLGVGWAAQVNVSNVLVPPDTMGRAVGFFFSFASVGWTVIPMLIGLVARKTDIQRGFLVAAASGAVFLTLIVIRGLMIG